MAPSARQFSAIAGAVAPPLSVRFLARQAGECAVTSSLYLRYPYLGRFGAPPITGQREAPLTLRSPMPEQTTRAAPMKSSATQRPSSRTFSLLESSQNKRQAGSRALASKGQRSTCLSFDVTVTTYVAGPSRRSRNPEPGPNYLNLVEASSSMYRGARQ